MIAPREYILMDQDVTGIADLWYDVCHDLASYCVIERRIYFFQFVDSGHEKPNWTNVRKSFTNSHKFGAFTYVYKVQLKYFDLDTRTI